MDLTTLLELTEEMPAYRQLVAEIKQGKGETLASVLDGAKPFLISALFNDLKRPLLMVTGRPENAKRLYDQIQSWRNSPDVLLFPEPDSLPYQRLVTGGAGEMERLRVLSALVKKEGDAPLIIASISALRQKIIPYQDFVSACFAIKSGAEISPFGLLPRLETIGYHRESLVRMPGEVGRRGGIIDIFPPMSELPARLEFFGNTIEGIRLFDPSTQRSVEEVNSIFISPATGMLLQRIERKELEERLGNLDLASLNTEAKAEYEEEIALMRSGAKKESLKFYAPLFNTSSLLDYLRAESFILLDEPENINLTSGNLDKEAGNLAREKQNRGELPHNFPKPYFNWEELSPKIKERRRLSLISWGVTENKRAYRLGFTPAPTYLGQLPVFIQRVRQFLRERQRVIIVTRQGARLAEMLDEAKIIASPLTEVKDIPQPGSLTLVQGSLASGWVMGGNTYLFTDAEIFGFVKERRLPRRRVPARRPPYTAFEAGGYVVHIEHGIAKFLGTTNMSGDGTEKEYLVLQYGAGDKLYVPAEQIDRVSRYIGAGEETPTLSRLGTQEWVHTKKRAEEAAEEIAKELLALYAIREVVSGFAYSPDSPWQQELEASFLYEETKDQLTAIKQVKEDMMLSKPMDRLVLGDVGYGKTEVAIRAAFKAVLDGKQVAVLVPTTVLAEQHFITFSQRMEAFPVKIEVLSRFRTPEEQEEVVRGLAQGAIDICIGTHRLLQKDVTFKDLGLLIIDEEQRFGVVHKEYLKQLKQSVDVLTLSATPIPRTLHMSLVGVRDISMIETPPEDRLPVRSFLAAYDEHLVREAILRELDRNGQVFFVHNRVQNIASIATRLKALLPEARISVAHGQMDEGELEMVMRDFAQGKSDVLVCTTIIESGLDMPNVNTLIVNRADRLGLTQLYQLRGRVGRGSELAYAYFLFDKEKKLTPTAERRLQTILEASELGAGFNVAMRDLEIRGAGTLLGTKQSGFISAVGFDLYTRLLSQAVEELKAKEAGKPLEQLLSRQPPPPSIELPLPAFLPEEYSSDINVRLDLYQRLANMKRAEEVSDMAVELTDRFGKMPQEVENLLYAVKIKILASKAGIEFIAHEPGYIVLKLFEGMEFDKVKLEPYLKYGIRIGTTQLRINSRRRLGAEWQGVLEEVLKGMG